MNVAVVLAGGTGTRVGGDKPKQFLTIDGRSVIERSIDAFDQAPGIDEVAVVVHPDWLDYMQQIKNRNHWGKLKQLIAGGSERYLSSLNAVAAYIDYPDETNLILHDAARPFVSQAVIARVVESLEKHDAVGVGIPSTDTVWEVRDDFDVEAVCRGEGVAHFVARIPERRTMWRAQTPQAFRLPVIRDAYQMALQDSNFRATDDCGVVRRYLAGVKVYIVEGEEQNRKITFAEDLAHRE